MISVFFMIISESQSIHVEK